MAVELINQANLLPANRTNSSQSGKIENVSEIGSARAVSTTDQAAVLSPKAEKPGQGSDDKESLKKLEKLVDEANALIQTTRRSVQFSVSEETGKPVIRVYDADSHKLIRQYPPDELIALVARIHEMVGKPGAGLILSDEA